MTQESDDYEAFIGSLVHGVRESGRDVRKITSGNASRIRGASGVWHQVDVCFEDHGFLTPNLVVVECKRWREDKHAGISVARNLQAVLMDLLAAEDLPSEGFGMLVVTSGVTSPALMYAKHHKMDCQVIHHGGDYQGNYGFWYQKLLQIGANLKASPAMANIRVEIIRAT